MVCDECKKRPATVSITTDINGKRTETHLCQECAQNHSEFGVYVEPGFTFHNILAGLFEPGGVVTGAQLQYKQKVRCPNCGLSFADFRNLGQLGCSECYVTFRDQLMPLIRRIHGSMQHTGKTAPPNPQAAKARELEELRRQLRAAITAEAYEKAAELRDAIRKLE